jgi:hypothetical protein
MTNSDEFEGLFFSVPGRRGLFAMKDLPREVKRPEQKIQIFDFPTKAGAKRNLCRLPANAIFLKFR